MSSMEVPRRNGQAVEQALREMTATLYKQQERINGLVNTMSSLMARLEQVEQAASRRRIAALGHGPTEAGRGDHD